MPNSKGQIRLLLVDDEVGYLEVLKKRIRKRNIDVTTASTGRCMKVSVNRACPLCAAPCAILQAVQRYGIVDDHTHPA